MISFQLNQIKIHSNVVCLHCLWIREKAQAMITEVTIIDFKEENILRYLKIKMSLIFRCFKGKKTSDWWGGFREKKVVNGGFEREKESCLSVFFNLRRSLNFTTCRVFEA